MRAKGITCDTGFLSAGTSTRERFDLDIVPSRIATTRAFELDLASRGVVNVLDGQARDRRGQRDLPWEPQVAVEASR